MARGRHHCVPYVPRTVAHRYSYVVVKGYITDAENVFMETMEVDLTSLNLT